MPTSRIETFPANPATVYEIMLNAAEAPGRYRIHVISARDHQAYFTSPGKAWRVSASVTDNGYREAVVHLSWVPPGSSGAGKCARRVIKGIHRTLAALEAPPPPPPTAP